MNKQNIKKQIIDIISGVSPESITADEIFNQLIAQVDPGRTQEEIRGLIKDIVNNDETLLGSSNKGYFYIKTVEQRDTAIEYLTHRIDHLQKRANNIRRLWDEQYNQ